MLKLALVVWLISGFVAAFILWSLYRLTTYVIRKVSGSGH